MILYIVLQKLKSKCVRSKYDLVYSPFDVNMINNNIFDKMFTVFRLFESVARSCMVVKAAAAAQQQSVEGELQEC